MLDAWEGVQRDGENPPEVSAEDRLALTAFHYLRNGMGGLDWAGLPVVCELLGVQDVDGLMRRLLVIKCYEPPKEE